MGGFWGVPQTQYQLSSVTVLHTGLVDTRQYTFVQHPFELSPCRCYLSPAVEPLHPGGSTLTPLPHMRRGEGPRSSAGKEHGWVFGRIRGTLSHTRPYPPMMAGLELFPVLF